MRPAHAPDCPCDSCRTYFGVVPAVGYITLLVAIVAAAMLLR